MASFQKELVDDKGEIQKSFDNPNEFLIQMMYRTDDFGTRLPGKGTLKLSNGLVSPNDRKFPGLYKILKKNPNASINFNCVKYDEEQERKLSDWVKNKSNEIPNSLITISDTRTPSYEPIHFELSAKVEALKQSYASQYSFLVQLVRLHLTTNPEQALYALFDFAEKYKIVPTQFRDLSKDNLTGDAKAEMKLAIAKEMLVHFR